MDANEKGNMGRREPSPADAVAAEIRRLTVSLGAPLLVAFDGRSGAGKSTLTGQVAVLVESVTVEGDDFYAGGSDADWAVRTPEDRADRCIDWRRLRREALEPLLAGRAAHWRPFNFAAGVGLADRVVTREPKPVILLDGVYSARPELADLVDLAVLAEAPNDRARRQRLIEREGEVFMNAWHALWDSAEDYYFSHVRQRSAYDLIVSPG